MLKIGLDIDGCILDYTKLLQEDYYNWCKQKCYTSKKICNEPRKFEDIISPEHIGEFETSKEFAEYFFGKPREGVLDFIKYIKDVRNRLNGVNDNVELYIITGRQNLSKQPFGMEEFFSFSLTDKWLKAQGIEYTGLEFGVIDKARLCEAGHFDYMIEDEIDNALAIAKSGTEVLLFDTILNQNFGGQEHITRVGSIYQIMTLINEKVQEILDLYAPTNLSGIELYEYRQF